MQLKVIRKSHEQRLLTKEHIVTCTHLNFKFKIVLYTSTLMIKLLLRSTVNQVQSSFSTLPPTMTWITFKTKVLPLVNNVQLVKHLLLLNEKPLQF